MTNTLVEIGRRGHGSGLADLLLECHERIRRHVALAVALGTRSDVDASEVVEVCLRCERYFAQALPLHVEDEEKSLLPRLRAGRAEVDDALATMARQHHEHAELLAAMLGALRSLRGAPNAPAHRASVHASATRLGQAFDDHLRLEEEVIFPAIDALLPPAQQALIVVEIRARRAKDANSPRDSEPSSSDVAEWGS